MFSMTPIGFYRAFEDEYRGSRELIQSRLQVYLPFVAQLQQLRPQLHALDLGCGRGEWLQLLHQQGVQCQGVDQDPDMLAACEQRQLPAVQGDAIAFLRSQPEQSQDIVSAFHLVEHLPFEALQELVGQAHRVLKEGGLLIMETPNPENLYVGSSNFHLDPSHNKPLPPLLLSFLPQHQGFERSRILRLQGKQTDWSEREIGLQNVLFDVSPDYAVVAQKGGAQQPLSQFDRLFEEEHGIGLHEMALRYDDGVKRRRQEYEGKIWNLAYRLEQLEKRASEPRAEQVGPTVEGAQGEPLQAQLEHERAQLEQAQKQRRIAEQRMQESAGQQEELRQRLEQVQGQLEGERQQGREREEQVRRRVRELEEQNRALRQSWSWRITAPLRAVMQQLQAMAQAATGKTRMLPSQGPDAPDAAAPPVWPTETMPPVPRHWSLANLPPHAKQLHQIIVTESHRRLPPEEQDRCAS